jgi:ribosomal protein S25
LSKANASVLSVVDSLFASPIVSVSILSQTLNMSFNTAQSAIKKLEDYSIVSEISGRQRNRIYVAPQILDVLQLPNA